MEQTASNPAPDPASAPGIDEQKALALFAEGIHTIAEIAKALGCDIAALAAWRAARQHGRDVRAIEKLYEQNARLMLARMCETLVAQGAAIATGSIQATETQRKMCVDMIRVCLAARRAPGVPRWSSTSSSARSRPRRSQWGQAAHWDGGSSHSRAMSDDHNNRQSHQDRDAADGGDRETDGEVEYPIEAICEALQRIGEENQRRVIAQREAHNAYVAANPHLGWKPLPVPQDTWAQTTTSDEARSPPGGR